MNDQTELEQKRIENLRADKPQRHNFPWTTSEIKQLERKVLQGYPIDGIAYYLRRSRSDLIIQLGKIGLIEHMLQLARKASKHREIERPSKCLCSRMRASSSGYPQSPDVNAFERSQHRKLPTH